MAHSNFRVAGEKLIQSDIGVAQMFQVLEDSRTALVAAWGGARNFFEDGRRVTASVVLIDKETGKFEFAVLGWGGEAKTNGTCRRISD